MIARFFGRVFSSLVALSIFSLIMIIFFVGLIIASDEQGKPVEEGSVLQINISGPVVERVQKDYLDELFASEGQMKPIGLDEVLRKINLAKHDDRIKGIYLSTNYPIAGISTIDDIREALISFKESGKFIYSYSEYYTKKGYYLTSVSDSIFMHPSGAIEFTGLQSEILFYNKLLQKLNIQPQVVRTGKWKSYAEQFLLDSLSNENRNQISNYINDVWNHMLNEISQIRGISQEDLNAMANELRIVVPRDAVVAGLVDGLKHEDQMLAFLEEKTGDDLSLIDIRAYQNMNEKIEDSDQKVAIIYAHGEVHMGKGEEGSIGSSRIAEAIKLARENDKVKAIVLRVNSGGGSALASEIIWREMELTKGVKPIVASIGDIAASGGYYIMANADTIVGRPNALTGSIGVVAMLFNVSGFFEEWLGITRDVVKTNKYSDLTSPYKSLSEVEEKALQRMVQMIYDDFLNRVAEGRNKTKEEVDALAMGQIYSGKKAKQLGLLDVYGGLNNSIDLAVEMANLQDYELITYPKLEDPTEKLFRDFQTNVKSKISRAIQPTLAKPAERLERMMESAPYHARMPFEIEIK